MYDERDFALTKKVYTSGYRVAYFSRGQQRPRKVLTSLGGPFFRSLEAKRNG